MRQRRRRVGSAVWFASLIRIYVRALLWLAALVLLASAGVRLAGL